MSDFHEYAEQWDQTSDRDLLLHVLHSQTTILHVLKAVSTKMSDLTAGFDAEDQAITDLGARIAAIAGPLQQAVADANAARDAAVAADVNDKAAADAANAQLTDALARVTTETQNIAGLAQPPAPPA